MFAARAQDAPTVAANAVELPEMDVRATAWRSWLPVRGYVAPTTTTGSKTDTPLIEAPQSVSVVTRDQIDGGPQRLEGEARAPGQALWVLSGFALPASALQAEPRQEDAEPEAGGDLEDLPKPVAVPGGDEQRLDHACSYRSWLAQIGNSPRRAEVASNSQLD